MIPLPPITNPALSANNPDNPRLSAGAAFLGQFLDHDMTFRSHVQPGSRAGSGSIRNFRIPALDLDSVYGGGPGYHRSCHDRNVDGGRTTLLVETNPGSAVTIDGQIRSDVPRNSQVTALIGDPRNDENLIVSQLHLSVVRFTTT